MMVMTVMLALTWVPVAFGAVSPEEAAKLGSTLTGVGAEMAGNKEGTIPPYTGGLTKPPASFKPGSGVYTDPFAGEKSIFSINAQNMAQYADKLTEGTKALMKRFPAYRIDIYKTHRTVAFPDFVIKNTAKNALTAVTYNGGLSLKGAHAGVPFPIPKDGYEVMWNHLTRFHGQATERRAWGYFVDANGRMVLTGYTISWEESPYYDEDIARAGDTYWKIKAINIAPPRRVGENAMMIDALNPYEKKRIAYQYLPGQRRVKLAPEIGFDTPNAYTAGNNSYDESWLFCGSMERYNMKLIGKKEFYIPYNAYKLAFTGKKEEVFGPKFLNPDFIRWELHRMWVVEATLKPNFRHIYPKRRLYIDEDSWAALANENYDAAGKLYKVNFSYQAPYYDVPAPSGDFCVFHNMSAGTYMGELWMGEGGYVRQVKMAPAREWAPGSLAGTGVR